MYPSIGQGNIVQQLERYFRVDLHINGGQSILRNGYVPCRYIFLNPVDSKIV